jgi:flagellar motor protein MotB
MRSAREVLYVLAVAIASAAPLASLQLKDVTDGRDHPIVSRYAGSVLIGYEAREFDEFTLPLGPLQRVSTTPARYEPGKTERLEGRVTRLLYVAPPKRTPLEVLRSYEQELTKSGFTILYRCTELECGGQRGFLSKFYLYTQARRLSDLPPGATGKSRDVTKMAFQFPAGQRYIAARLSRPEGDVHASIYVATETWDFFPETRDRTLVLLDIVEAVPIKTGMVTVDADAMAKEIAAAGHVALYGILFDTGRAEVKPESEPVLAEIAALLKRDPALTLFVVGHTDNVGGFDVNMDLSRRRAAAVVASLTSGHGIAAARLTAAGVGMLSPVAPNDTEEGRAKNRRVELVRR